MYKNIVQNRKKRRIVQKSSEFLLCQSNTYLHPLEQALDQQIDHRYVQTFFNLFVAILAFRNRAMGLLLSELGAYISGFKSAPADTKRISRLLRCKDWTYEVIDRFFFERTKDRIQQMQAQAKRPLLLWDDSRIEKHESWFIGGLCSVFSSKGQRLTKIKRGYYRPPSSRICVPGYKWTAVLLSGL